MTKKRLFVFLLVFVLVLSLVTPGLARQNGPAQQALSAFDQRIINSLDVNRALEHIRYMSKDIGPRPGGLENEAIAAAYIGEYFADLGYEPEVQSFSVGNQGIANITVHGAENWFGKGEWNFNEWHGTEWEAGAAQNGYITGDDEKVSGYVVDCGAGNVDDFPEEVAGNIALVRRGTAFTTLVNRAKEAGATGVMIQATIGGRGNYGSAFSPNVSTDIPVIGLAQVQGWWLQEMIAEGPVFIDVQTHRYTNLTSQNVVATKAAKVDNAPIVVIGGHYDSVVGAPGANDNLSGTSIVMEMARVFRNIKTDDYEIRFALWGSEERGLLGARHYVNTLSDDELERHIANYNVDMVATTAYEEAPYLYVETVDGNPNIVTETSLAAASRLGYDVVRQSQFPSSDHVPFDSAGIPAAMYIWLGGAGTPQDYSIELVYHTPQDTIEENICIDRLELAMNVVGAAVNDLVRKPVPALTNSAIRR